VNRGVEPAAPGVGITVSDEDDEYIENGTDDTETSDEETQDDGAMTAFPGVTPPRIGERHEILITSNSHLVLYAQDEIFEFEDGDFNWAFRYIEGNVGDHMDGDHMDNLSFGRTATLEITFKSITVQGIEAHAIDFLNQYSGSQTSVFNGLTSIMDTRLMGYHVSTNHLGRTYEAWIHTLLDSDVSLVFVLSYENDIQRNALYLVLNSADIVAIGVGEPETGESGDDDQTIDDDDQLPEDD